MALRAAFTSCLISHPSTPHPPISRQTRVWYGGQLLSVLRADMTLSTSDPAYGPMLALASVFACIYAIGIPAAGLACVYSRRTRLDEPKTELLFGFLCTFRFVSFRLFVYSFESEKKKKKKKKKKRPRGRQRETMSKTTDTRTSTNRPRLPQGDVLLGSHRPPPQARYHPHCRLRSRGRGDGVLPELRRDHRSG